MKTTKKQFEEFKSEFLRYVDLLGLKGYKFFFRHQKLNGSYAQVDRCEKARAAVVTLSCDLDQESLKDWDGPKSSARHEAMHMLLSPLAHIGSCRWASSCEIDAAEEAIVRVLEKVIHLPT